MKTVRILALHLAYGGIEKAIISMANLFAERYPVEILSVYRMPGSPAFPLDERVNVRYLLEDLPNREEWKQALRDKAVGRFLQESVRAVRTLSRKKRAVREAVRSVHDGVLITTRHEDNLVLSREGDPTVLKIAQLHRDHAFDKHYLQGFRHAYGGLDVFALLTPGLVEEVRGMMPDREKPRLVFIPNFLEHYPEHVELNGREQVLLSVGRLDPIKGFDRLIRCFAKIRAQRNDWQLRIVGDGAEREKLESLVHELGLDDAVCLTGRLDAEGVEREMLRASLFVMSSHSEGFPFVLLEAQSCGLPVVAFDVRVGPGAIVTDEGNGFLIPDGDEEAFAAKTLQLLDDAALRRKMAEAAMSNAQKYSRENVAKIWESVIGDGET